MGYNKVNDHWTRVRGVRPRVGEDEEVGEEGGEEGGPSSPHADVAVDEEPLPGAEDVGGATDAPEVSERHSAPQYRDQVHFDTPYPPVAPSTQDIRIELNPDQISAIAREVARHLQSSNSVGQWDNITVPHHDMAAIVPHSSCVTHMISDVMREIRNLSSEMLRFTGRQLDFERSLFDMQRAVTLLNERVSPEGSSGQGVIWAAPTSLHDLVSEAAKLRSMMLNASGLIERFASDVDK